ncbi:MAG: hypothetical protein ACKO96_26710 [Flammeovirgaceae bacterium]
MKTYLTTALLFLCLSACRLAGQTTLPQTTLPQLRGISPIPQTPNAMAISKYGDVPVGHYTGSMNFEVPLYTIKTKDFEFPFSASYTATGIRVPEEAGPIGLGWALNAGGTITHVVNDRNISGTISWIG